jgi:hypothetical protein
MMMAKKTTEQLSADITAVLASGNAKTLSGMHQMLEALRRVGHAVSRRRTAGRLC